MAILYIFHLLTLISFSEDGEKDEIFKKCWGVRPSLYFWYVILPRQYNGNVKGEVSTYGGTLIFFRGSVLVW